MEPRRSRPALLENLVYGLALLLLLTIGYFVLKRAGVGDPEESAKPFARDAGRDQKVSVEGRGVDGLPPIRFSTPRPKARNIDVPPPRQP